MKKKEGGNKKISNRLSLLFNVTLHKSNVKFEAKVQTVPCKYSKQCRIEFQ